jgi:hypothetical protein
LSEGINLLLQRLGAVIIIVIDEVHPQASLLQPLQISHYTQEGLPILSVTLLGDFLNVVFDVFLDVHPEWGQEPLAILDRAATAVIVA